MPRSRKLKVVPIAPPVTPAADEAPRSHFVITDSVLAASRVRPTRQQRADLRTLSANTFRVAEPMPGVLPEGRRALAMDEVAPTLDHLAWAADTYYNSALAEGTIFLGYAYLSALAQRSEYRVVSETIANEATREWIEIKSAGDDKGKADVIGKIYDRLEELNAREVCCTGVEHDGLFGRGHIYLDTGDTDDREELVTDLGDGRNSVSHVKISPDRPLRAIRTVEPVWTYPSRYNSVDPLSEDWYRPNAWYVMGKEVHRSRFLTLVGRPVSDTLKPAYAFGGLSMSQMLKPYVDNWLRTRQSVSDLIHSFSIPVLKTNLNVLMQKGGQGLFNRGDLFNNLRDNRSLMFLDKDTEDFMNVQTSLGTLDQLQAQAQEQMAAIARIPLVKLLGISPHGLNASSDGEIRAFYDWIRSFQHRLIGPALKTIFYFVQLSLFGKIDRDLTFDFRPLWQLDETQRSQVNLTKSQTYAADIQAGVVDPTEVREAYREDKNSPYSGLDLEGDAPGPPGMGEGGVPSMDPLAASEDDATDPHAAEHVDTWRRKAAALFADEDELGYWQRRASNLFNDADGEHGRWAALATKLYETANDPEPLERWQRRVGRWVELAAALRADEVEFEDEDDKIVYLEQPRGENVVNDPPVSEFAEHGSENVRWDRGNGSGRHAATPRQPVAGRKFRNAAARIERNIASDAKTDEFVGHEEIGLGF